MPRRAEMVLTNKPTKGSTFLKPAFSTIGVIPQKKMVASQSNRVFTSIGNNKVYQPFRDNPLFRIIIFKRKKEHVEGSKKIIQGGDNGTFEREEFPS